MADWFSFGGMLKLYDTFKDLPSPQEFAKRDVVADARDLALMSGAGVVGYAVVSKLFTSNTIPPGGFLLVVRSPLWIAPSVSAKPHLQKHSKQSDWKRCWSKVSNIMMLREAPSLSRQERRLAKRVPKQIALNAALDEPVPMGDGLSTVQTAVAAFKEISKAVQKIRSQPLRRAAALYLSKTVQACRVLEALHFASFVALDPEGYTEDNPSIPAHRFEFLDAVTGSALISSMRAAAVANKMLLAFGSNMSKCLRASLLVAKSTSRDYNEYVQAIRDQIYEAEKKSLFQHEAVFAEFRRDPLTALNENRLDSSSLGVIRSSGLGIPISDGHTDQAVVSAVQDLESSMIAMMRGVAANCHRCYYVRSEQRFMIGDAGALIFPSSKAFH